MHCSIPDFPPLSIEYCAYTRCAWVRTCHMPADNRSHMLYNKACGLLKPAMKRCVSLHSINSIFSKPGKFVRDTIVSSGWCAIIGGSTDEESWPWAIEALALVPPRLRQLLYLKVIAPSHG